MKGYITHGPLGKLAKWLRLLGFDVVYMREVSDEILLEAARREGRILITKKRSLFSREVVAVLSDRVEDQVLEFLKGSGERLRADIFFTICSLCNEPLEEVARDEACRLGAPEYVLSMYGSFKWCQVCGRIYWPGSHRKRFLGRVAKIMNRVRDSG